MILRIALTAEVREKRDTLTSPDHLHLGVVVVRPADHAPDRAVDLALTDPAEGLYCVVLVSRLGLICFLVNLVYPSRPLFPIIQDSLCFIYCIILALTITVIFSG